MYGGCEHCQICRNDAADANAEARRREEQMAKENTDLWERNAQAAALLDEKFEKEISAYEAERQERWDATPQEVAAMEEEYRAQCRQKFVRAS